MLKIDINRSEKWVAFAVTGVLSIPPIGLGLGPDMYLIQDPKDPNCGSSEIFSAVEESFHEFGITDHGPLTLNYIKVLLIPMKDISDYGIKIGLMVADLALSVFNKKVTMARARLINWHRRDGMAVGAMFESGKWTALKPRNTAMGPALQWDPGTSYWDKFLHDHILGKLTPLGKALSKCMSWDRESQQTANISHRFAFSWIGLESMLPPGEKDGPGAGKRFSILVGAPSKYYSRKINENNQLKIFLTANPNPHAKIWKGTIDDMFRYRCEIFHEGGTEFTSDTIEPLKADWYAKVADFLCDRLVTLGGMAFKDNVDTVEEFWDLYVPHFLISSDNHWNKSGVFFGGHLIKFDWSSGLYPEINHI
ncbi:MULTISPECIES: hypothetical protein [Xanthomonas]|uniref:hypothetical protein n=1 Tax=Xanthomonas TaxID=338 RepID=UPI000A9AA18B|nr:MULTISPECIES: hypothetical protein [Xanthomonas]MBO9749433.1 hypothetical protein [Xanthomonas phaseoli pv. dieffenbachiae]MBO9745519.1 hypothetical protein [Xanthomonas phaseoli pv. phaseoli]MBO9751726.1 hypothetical protein [Xanthomonas phaseoli pv. dieffenbachiae]MBO9891662.1 hypothetical protein [Xanthomonas sp. D-36-1]QUF60020.1 hypothetical protein XppCFBP6164P_24570 [Xanthomonas phaseoli pv. phaseoli]